MNRELKQQELVIFQNKQGEISFRGDLKHETIWASLDQIARLFGRDKSVISRHLKKVYQEEELTQEATVAKNATVQIEGNREVVREIEYYNLDAIISVGYRVNSKAATQFRQWATKTLRQHIVEGYTINPKRVGQNYATFLKAVEQVQAVLPAGDRMEGAEVLELVKLFADTWFSLDAYDKELLSPKKVSKKKVKLTADELTASLEVLKGELLQRKEATDNFAQPRSKEALAGIVGNVMQSFGGKAVYPTVEGKAAHLLYFIIKNHPFVDGNKRSGAYAFVWFLHKARVLNTKQLTPTALTALTLLIAESDPADKEKVVALVTLLIARR